MSFVAGMALLSCAGSQSNLEAPSTLQTSQVLPHCTEDRRPSYSMLEMPPINNLGNAPTPYLDALYDGVAKQVEKRGVWRVVPERNTVKDVIIFNISMLSWKDDPDAPKQKRLMDMKLSLVDKHLGCEVNETTGQGQVVLDSSGSGTQRGIDEIADGAGWFVENVLLHNQYN